MRRMAYTDAALRQDRKFSFVFKAPGLEWRVRLERRLGLRQLAEQRIKTPAGVVKVGARSVYEYAIEVVEGDRTAWAGNGHRFDLPSGKTRIAGNDAHRRSLLLNPLRPWQRLAVVDVTYRATRQGLRVEQHVRWLADAHIGRHYVASLPLGGAFDLATAPVDAELTGGDGTVHGLVLGNVVAAQAPGIGVEASIELDAPAIVSVEERRGESVASLRAHHETGMVRRGDSFTAAAIYRVASVVA